MLRKVIFDNKFNNVTNGQKIADYRQQEQDEINAQIKNAKEARFPDGTMNLKKLSKEDLKTYATIYNKYDKLITPLLNDEKEDEAIETPPNVDKYYESIKMSSGNGKDIDRMYSFPTPTGAYTMLNYVQQVLVRTSHFKQYFGDWELAAKNFLADNKNNFKVHYKNVSKVINMLTLEPLVVYHGSSAEKEFFEFDATRKNEIGRPYAYFADNIEYSQNFIDLYKESAKSLLYKGFLKITNPFFALGENFEKISRNVHYWMHELTKRLYLDKEGVVMDEAIFQAYTIATHSQLEKYLVDKFGDLEIRFWQLMSTDKDKIFKTFMIVNGYDGVRYTEEFDINSYDENNPKEFTKAWTIFDANQIKLADGRNINFDAMNKDIRYEKGGNIEPNNRFQSNARALRAKIGLGSEGEMRQGGEFMQGSMMPDMQENVANASFEKGGNISPNQEPKKKNNVDYVNDLINRIYTH